MKKQKEEIFQLPDNDVFVKIIFNGDEVDEIHASVLPKEGWTVIGWKDLKNAIKKAKVLKKKKQTNE